MIARLIVITARTRRQRQPLAWVGLDCASVVLMLYGEEARTRGAAFCG